MLIHSLVAFAKLQKGSVTEHAYWYKHGILQLFHERALDMSF